MYIPITEMIWTILVNDNNNELKVQNNNNWWYTSIMR